MQLALVVIRGHLSGAIKSNSLLLFSSALGATMFSRDTGTLLEGERQDRYGSMAYRGRASETLASGIPWSDSI